MGHHPAEVTVPVGQSQRVHGSCGSACSCFHCALVSRSDALLLKVARLAQSVEHETLNLRVVGSSPTLGAASLLRHVVFAP